MLMSEIPTFVPSEKYTLGFKTNLDTSSLVGKEVATRQEPQDSKTDVPIHEKDDYYPEKKNKNRMRKKKKNAILNMPEGVNITDALRHNGIHTKPLHKKLTPNQKKSLLMDQEVNDDYFDDGYVGLPAPIGGFKADLFRHPRKCLSALPSQEEQFRQRNLFTSQITNKKNSYKVGGSNNAYSDWNNRSLNSFMENDSTPKDNKKSNHSLPSNNYNASFKMNDATRDYNYPNNRNSTMKVESPEKKSSMQHQAPNTGYYLNGRKLKERQLDKCFDFKDSHCSNESKSTETFHSQSSTNSQMFNPAYSSDLNAVVSLLQRAISNKDKKNRGKNLSAKDVVASVQAAMKDNEDIESELESDADFIDYKKISKKSKNKCVENNKKTKRNKKKKYHISSDTETETETSVSDFEYKREKKRNTKQKKSEKKLIKQKDYYTTSDYDSNFGSDFSSESDSDLEYSRRYNKYNSKKKINLLKSAPDLDLELRRLRQMQRQKQKQRNKKEKEKMQKLLLNYESESNSDSDYNYKEMNGSKGKLKHTVIRRVKEQDNVRIRRDGNKRKASKKKLFSNWNYSDNEYLMKKEKQTKALKEMEENYYQMKNEFLKMKNEFLKMKMTMEGLKNKKNSNDIMIEEPEGVTSEGNSQSYKPKLLTYNNRSFSESNGHKRKNRLKSKPMDHNDESSSNDKKKVKNKFRNLSNDEHKFSSESEFDSDYYGSKIPKSKPENSFDELYSDFKDEKQYREKKYKKKFFKISSYFSNSDFDSDSQFEEKKIVRARTKDKKQLKSKLRSFSSGSDSFTDYEEKKKVSDKEKEKENVVSDSDSDSDSGSDFYEVKNSLKGRSKPNPMESADESFSDYEEKESKMPKNMSRR